MWKSVHQPRPQSPNDVVAPGIFARPMPSVCSTSARVALSPSRSSSVVTGSRRVSNAPRSMPTVAFPGDP